MTKMKCPQLNKPKDTETRNQTPPVTEMEKRKGFRVSSYQFRRVLRVKLPWLSDMFTMQAGLSKVTTLYLRYLYLLHAALQNLSSGSLYRALCAKTNRCTFHFLFQCAIYLINENRKIGKCKLLGYCTISNTTVKVMISVSTRTI